MPTNLPGRPRVKNRTAQRSASSRQSLQAKQAEATKDRVHAKVESNLSKSKDRSSSVVRAGLFGRHWLAALTLVMLLAAILVCVLLQQQNSHLTAKLDAAEANTLLVLQQTDALHRRYVLPLQKASLTEVDVAALQAWLPFDEQFVIRNRSNPDLRYEVATVLVRDAIVYMLLGGVQAATAALQEAEERLGSLVEDLPGDLQYTVGRASVWVLRAKLLAEQGSEIEAQQACRQAIGLAESVEEQARALSRDGCRSVRSELTELMIQLGEKSLAKMLAEDHVHKLEQQLQENPSEAWLAAELETARKRLSRLEGSK